MSSVGDAVVYRHHVCKITGIREKYYQDEDYYELHALFENRLKLFVKISEAKPPAMRPVMSRQQALDLIDSIPTDENTIDPAAMEQQADTPTLLDKRIKEEYEKHLKTFSPEELLPIMKFAYRRSKARNENGREATATDKKYFTLAQNLLCDELAVSLDIDRDEVEEFMNERIEQAQTA